MNQHFSQFILRHPTLKIFKRLASKYSKLLQRGAIFKDKPTGQTTKFIWYIPTEQKRLDSNIESKSLTNTY